MSYDPGAESSATFRAYMQRFALTVLDVAFAGQVRPMTVWNIGRGLPIRAEHALSVRSGLYRFTGVPYTALISTIPADILVMTQAPQAGKKP